jgi:hypothetical protein
MLAQFTGLPAGAFAVIYGEDPANFQFRTMFCGDIATGQIIQPQNSAVQLPNAGGATCFVFYKVIEYGDGPEANPNAPSDPAGSGVVDLFEVGCENVQPGLSFQELRAVCTTQLPARQVVLGTSAGESLATTATAGSCSRPTAAILLGAVWSRSRTLATSSPMASTTLASPSSAPPDPPPGAPGRWAHNMRRYAETRPVGSRSGAVHWDDELGRAWLPDSRRE